MKTIFFSIILTCFFIFSHENIKAQTASPVSELNLASGLVNFLSLTFDSRTMVYASRLKNETQYAFYTREKGANAWTEPKGIIAINNLITPTTKIGGSCFNYNGSVIYFSIDIGDGNGMDIYFTKKVNNEWQAPEKINKIINSSENESDPSISPDGNTFYFVRDIIDENDFTDDYDCKKIMVSEKLRTGKWGKPYRLPSQINSGCESSPKISSDNITLLFSSVKNKDTEFDIYSTKMIAKGIWSNPIKIETISGEASDIYPNITFAGDEVYCVKQLKKNSKKETDIVYKAKIPAAFSPQKSMVLKGKITSSNENLQAFKKINNSNISDLEKPMFATIKVVNPFTSKIISTFTTDSKTGEYSFFLNSKTSYRIDFSSENHSHEIVSYEIGVLDSNIVEEKNVKLYSNASLILNTFDEENFQPLETKIEIFDNETDELLSLKKEQLFLGRNKIILPLGKEYKILASKKNYVSDTLIFNIKKVVQFDEFEKDIELAVLKRNFIINLKDGDTDVPISADIIIVNKSRKEEIILDATQAKDGKYNVPLREGDVYEINVLSSQGYAYRNTEIDLTKEKAGEKNIGLMALKAASTLELNNIIFETNSAELTTVSFTELDRVVELMTKNPTLRIEISAHTDNVGSDAYNLKLSERRAQSVVDYLKDKNANPEQLIAKGYGEKKPIAENDTDENKAKNRRVELSILDEHVKAE